MSIQTYKPVEISLDLLIPNPENPKATIGDKYDAGLDHSLDQFGHTAVLVVTHLENCIQKGSHVVMDGNTRLDKLRTGGVAKVFCVVLPRDLSMNHERLRLFALSFDKNRALFDPEMVSKQAEELLQSTSEEVRRLVEEMANYEPLPIDPSLLDPGGLGPGAGDIEPNQARFQFYSIACTVQEKLTIERLVGRIKDKIPTNLMNRVLARTEGLTAEDVAARFAIWEAADHEETLSE